MPTQPLTVKVILKVKHEYLEAFIVELTSVREKCLTEKDCLLFDIDQRLEDPGVVMLTEVWSSREYFENVQLKRDYFPPYFAAVAPMMAAPIDRTYWTSVATYPKREL